MVQLRYHGFTKHKMETFNFYKCYVTFYIIVLQPPSDSYFSGKTRRIRKGPKDLMCKAVGGARMLAKRCLRILATARPVSRMKVAVGRGLYTDAFMTVDVFKERRVSAQYYRNNIAYSSKNVHIRTVDV